MPTPLDDRLILTDDVAVELARSFGTPLYVISEAHLRHRIRRYLAAFRAVWPASTVTYASKANSTLAVLKIAHDEGCLIDVASEGELRAAQAAGVPAAHCHFHGNFKKLSELRYAIAQGVDQVMVDSMEEIDSLLALQAEGIQIPHLMLRLAPGVEPKTNAKISTGQADTKFGFNIANGDAERAVMKAISLPLHGVHCHVGSQLLDPEAQRLAGISLARFAREMEQRHGFVAKEINIGGGLGVRYRAEDRPMPVEEYCRLVVRDTIAELGDLNPVLTQEPGRTLIAECGVTLYEIGPVKDVPTSSGARRYVTVDGGLSDNPRPALYASLYEVVPVAARTAETRLTTVAGRHCETDNLFQDCPLPTDIKTGDLVQVLCTGAYNSSMASNYNRFLRPATVLIRPDGRAQIVQTRESFDQLFAREQVPADL